MASVAKHPDVARLGPDRILPRTPDNLRQTLADEKITVVADVVGGPYWPHLIDILERGGRYTCSGAIAGPMVELDLRTFYLRDLTFTGSTVIDPEVTKALVRYIEAGEIKPVLAATYPLAELRQAQAAFIAKEHTGNIVVLATEAASRIASHPALGVRVEMEAYQRAQDIPRRDAMAMSGHMYRMIRSVQDKTPPLAKKGAAE
jgi:D-arabinose 1-dehydrogenase-like Zn-dependent alcohol dehydrogenase